jgi:hypothetical protein
MNKVIRLDPDQHIAVVEPGVNGLCRIRHSPFNAGALAMPSGGSLAGLAPVDSLVLGLSVSA